LKDVGKVHVQVVVDIFCSLAFAKAYNSKMPITPHVICSTIASCLSTKSWASQLGRFLPTGREF
jgi:hypothetical protein